MNLVLVLDDHEDVCDVVATALGDRGFSVLCVTSAKTALEKIAQWRPALVIADVRLPDGDGVSVAAAAIAHGARAVLMSGHPVEIGRFSEGGEYPFIPKPFNITMLVNMVARELLQSSIALAHPTHRRRPHH
jgi:two-component system OmpR family response regulator